jgi:glycosyltransferase involved in cell wall biosynthesis
MKKVLIVSYYWPPAGGPGVQRWLKFVKYLPEFGIEPHVYVPENPAYPIVDERLVQEVPNDAVVIRRKILEPYGLAALFSKRSVKKISAGIIPAKKKQSPAEKTALWIRGNLFIPDARVLWVGPSVSFLKKYMAENGISTIVTTGPPHSLHLIGLGIKRAMNVNWIADFRDPWTTIGYHQSLRLSAHAQKKHKALESEVLNGADGIIVTSPSTKLEFQSLTQKPIAVITNGYDISRSAWPLDEKFTLAHIGSLLSERNPGLLWAALADMVKNEPGFATDLELKLIGTVSDDVVASIAACGLTQFLNLKGYVPHEEAVEAQQRSQVLLLIEIDSPETRGIIPGKLFEYLVSGRPIIGIGPKGSDFSSILEETEAGIFVDYGEAQKLQSALSGFYSQYKSGALSADAKNIERYSRRSLTQKLSELINGKWE